MQKFKLTALTTLLVVLLSACQNIPENESDSELNIYTTVYPLEYIVEKIGQDTVEVSSVFPPGVDGHSYEPTMQEMTQYADGDAFCLRRGYHGSIL